MKSFRSIIDDRIPLLFDGAIGTELYKRGMFINRSFEEANLTNSSLVRGLHEEYRKSGADVLTANSWGANRYKLKGHNLQEKVHQINLEAARIAREAAAGELYVAGSVGPLGLRMEPLGTLSVRDAFAAFEEQVRGLAEGGVDFIILETFADIAEMHQAILAVKSVDPGLPICSCLTVNLSGNSELGSSLESAIPELVQWGAEVVGLNCSVGPQPMLSAIKRMKRLTAAPLIAQPNAGLPREIDGRQIYMATPEYFAEFTRYFLQEGVQFVGGCCGTGPEHIRAMAQAMRQFRAMSRGSGPGAGRAVVAGDSPPAASEAVPEAPRLPFAEKSKWSAKIAGGEKVCTLELVPPSGITAEKMLVNAKSIKEAGIDAINIPDGPRASSRMSAIVTAIMIEQRVGIETILHYTCRDRNLVGMQADMLGAHAIGLRNLLLITGDPPKLGDYPNATGVFDIDAIGLVKMVHRLNGGIDIGGKPIGEPTSLSIGVGVNPVHPDFDFEMDRFRRKVESGAEWAITQPVFDAEAMEAFLEYLYKRSMRIPVIMGIWPLTSLRNAQFMNSEVPGIRIPDSIMARMAGAETPQAAASRGVEIAQEMYSRMIDKIQGAQLSAPFGRVDHALRVLGKA
jgi:methionine synthase / methylenetetrahydrofolate reductase(NADPH)